MLTVITLVLVTIALLIISGIWLASSLRKRPGYRRRKCIDYVGPERRASRKVAGDSTKDLT